MREEVSKAVLAYVTGERQSFKDEALLAAIEAQDAAAVVERFRELTNELAEKPKIEIDDPRYDDLLMALMMTMTINLLIQDDEETPESQTEYDDGNGAFYTT